MQMNILGGRAGVCRNFATSFTKKQLFYYDKGAIIIEIVPKSFIGGIQ